MGTRCIKNEWYTCGEDHPHAYGDKSNPKMRPEVTRGSSPRVWGQVHTSEFGAIYARIIPTRMGTRIISSLGFPIAWDHPHAYGDKTWTANTIFGIVGSSPRVWGQERNTSTNPYIGRIIPTRMGTSL